jgi:hypothetical protein
MSTITGWYYLHTNGQLIYKRDSPGQDADIRESDFAVALWAWNNDRLTAWNILVEALSLKADKNQILKLANTWGCDDRDAVVYAMNANIKLGKDGAQLTACRKDFINLQESPMGFGKSYLEAMADLCKKLGYKGGKMWNASFPDLLKANTIVES